MNASIATSPVWSSPEFWLAAPAILFLLVFGGVMLVALLRARPEDVPRVLSIFSSMCEHLVATLRRGSGRVPAGIEVDEASGVRASIEHPSRATRTRRGALPPDDRPGQ